MERFSSNIGNVRRIWRHSAVYIYYFQWEFWQRSFLIYEVIDWKIFKSFTLHCSLLSTMVISVNYFAIYILQKTNSCIDSFIFYSYRYHLFIVSICHKKYWSLQLSMVIYNVALYLQLVQKVLLLYPRFIYIYIVDVTSLHNQALIIFGEWLKMCIV